MGRLSMAKSRPLSLGARKEEECCCFFLVSRCLYQRPAVRHSADSRLQQPANQQVFSASRWAIPFIRYNLHGTSPTITTSTIKIKLQIASPSSSYVPYKTLHVLLSSLSYPDSHKFSPADSSASLQPCRHAASGASPILPLHQTPKPRHHQTSSRRRIIPSLHPSESSASPISSALHATKSIHSPTAAPSNHNIKKKAKTPPPQP